MFGDARDPESQAGSETGRGRPPVPAARAAAPPASREAAGQAGLRALGSDAITRS
jgi:hypothetical protein